MATVIHELWREEDKNPLILPAHFPIDSERVNFELTRYLSDNWRPIIDKDVDGPASMPMRFDEQFPNLGRFSASRKVARTIFIGSAPKEGTGQRGIEVQRINIGSILPGEQTSIFSDALRRMVGGGTYLLSRVRSILVRYSTCPSPSWPGKELSSWQAILTGSMQKLSAG